MQLQLIEKASEIQKLFVSQIIFFSNSFWFFSWDDLGSLFELASLPIIYTNIHLRKLVDIFIFIKNSSNNYYHDRNFYCFIQRCFFIPIKFDFSSQSPEFLVIDPIKCLTLVQSSSYFVFFLFSYQQELASNIYFY